MQYQQAFRYIIDRRGGFVSLLLLTVCQFIPLIGPIVTLGYQAEVAVALDRDPDLRRHPKFTFDYFVDYLKRGVWPFLIQLIFSMLLSPIMIGAFVAGILIAPLGPNNPPILMLVLFGAAFITIIVVTVLYVPMIFHAGFTGEFDFGAAFRFSVAFWKLVGGQALVTGLAYMLLSWVVMILGLLCCCVGIYPASVLIQMASTHLMVQLYREYLDRGGEPLVEYDPWERADEREDERWLRFDEREDDPPRE